MDALDLIAAEYPAITLLCLTLMGACIGSFLNVVIYRLPLGLSVHRPSRSFCPQCKALIPWYHNIPLVSWVLLRGRSACCGQPISARYWLVEAACTALFFLMGWNFAYESLPTQLLLCGWCACMLALLAMDWEQMVVHVPLALLAAGCGVAAAWLDPQLTDPADTIRLFSESGMETAGLAYPWSGLVWGVVGAGSGYLLFRLVALGGRLMFGRRSLHFAEPEEWQLRQEGEDIVLTVGGQRYLWTEVFPESSASIVLEDAVATAVPEARGKIVLEEAALVLPDGTRKSLEDYESLGGTCAGLSLERSAMGSGDPWLALAIGSVCGWQGIIFALVGGSIIGLLFALLMRVRRGVPMPFGPSLILAAYIWLLWGPQVLEAYLSLL